MGHFASICIVLLIMVAGCSATETSPSTTTIISEDKSETSPYPTPNDPSATTATLPSTSSQTPTATPSPSPTPTPLPPQNPWRKETVTIRVNGTTNSDRQFGALVHEAVMYWNGQGEQYATYPVTFQFRPNADDPDIEVRFVSVIDRCGIHNDSLSIGCATVLDADSTPENPEIVLVRADLNDESLRKVILHELGHILGIEHGEPPYAYMNEITDVTYYNKTDAYDRANPWQWDQIRIAYNLSDVPTYEQAQTKEQLGHALDYYNEGADGYTPENVSFRLTDNESRADIVIDVFRDTDGTNDGSIGRAYGLNIDEDDALEYFTYYYIEIEGIPNDRRGWHAGYWLGFALGANSTDELPPPFDEPESDDRENWWN